mmetsp:Transcript_20777/g.50971  ORF Transcript_20777/g.50971 Transcript_20777/m.50971 type:complete len:230 (-) Transcript_20777:69-758(-)
MSGSAPVAGRRVCATAAAAAAAVAGFMIVQASQSAHFPGGYDGRDGGCCNIGKLLSSEDPCSRMRKADGPPEQTLIRKDSLDYSRFNIEDSEGDRPSSYGDVAPLPTEEQVKRMGYNDVNSFLNYGWYETVKILNDLVPMVRENGASLEYRRELSKLSHRVMDLQESMDKRVLIDHKMGADEARAIANELLPIVKRTHELRLRIFEELDERNERVKRLLNSDLNGTIDA